MKKPKSNLNFKSFLQSQQATGFWALVFLCLLGYVVAQPKIIENRVQSSKEKAVILDQSGSFHISKLKEPNELKPLVDYMAYQSAKALLERTKTEMVHYELAAQCFKPEMKKKIMDQFSKESKIFKEGSERRIRKFTELKYYSRSRNKFDLAVFGEMVRTDLFEGQKIYTVTPFKLSLLLVRNPLVGQNDFMPLAVSNYILELKEGRVQ